MEVTRVSYFTIDDLKFWHRLANRGWHLKHELTGLELERFCQMASELLELKEKQK